MTGKIKVEVLGLSFSNQAGQNIPYIVILGKPEDKLRIPIIIGSSEAQSIAIAMEKISAPRPLSHDIITTLTNEFDITIKEVIIYEYEEGVFFAKIICNNNYKEREIECRPSDGIAIALRLNIPIYTYQNIFDEAGVNIEDKVSSSKRDKENENYENIPIEELNIEQLNKYLNKAIKEENYELASTINERIKSLTTNNSGD